MIACSLNAAIIRNPDANTLWLEDGKQMKFSSNAYSGDWLNEKCNIIPEEDGFVFEPKSGNRAEGGICLPVSRDYPYLEFDLEAVEKGKDFYFLVNAVNIGPWYSLGGEGFRPGHYVFNVFENAKKMPEKSGAVFFQFRVYNGKVRIKNLQMVKKPSVQLDIRSGWFDTKQYFSYEACLEFLIPDDKLPQKPIRLRFFEAGNGEEIELNHTPFLELKKIPGYPGNFAAAPSINAFIRKELPAGSILIEVEGFDQPAFTWFAYPWKPGPIRDATEILPADYSWIQNLRTDHPRIFLNQEILPKMRAWAEKTGYQQILADAENFVIDPTLTHKQRGAVGDTRPYSTQEVTVPHAYEEEALTCALAYLLTGDKKYAEKTWIFLDHNLSAYRTCAEKRTAISWYGIGRIENMAAVDWVWNASDPVRCRQYVKDFIDVNILYARHGWYGPFYGINGGTGKVSGFYGDANTELFMGILAYREGVCDDLALDMLKKGYDKYRECLSFRDGVAEDDGILATTAMGYSAGQYPWVSYDFLYLWRAAFQTPVKLPKLTHLLYYGEWFLWNMLPGKGDISIREFGIGDNAKTIMRMFSISGHLYTVLGAYGKAFPDESVQIAQAIARMDGKYNPDYFHEKQISKRTKAPPYHWGFFRKYLAYDMDGVQIPPANEEKSTAPMVMARHFPVGGLLFMRSGTDADSTRALFNIGSSLTSHKTRGDENHFTIFRKGYLAIDAGYRNDTWYAQVKYHHSSMAHNTMLIHDPAEKFQTDEAECRAAFERFHHAWADTPEQDELFKKHEPFLADAQGSQNKPLGGKCRAFSTNEFYTYIAGDATKVYSAEKCREFNRQFIHIQPDAFIVFDRVESVNPDFRKEWLLHFLEEPAVNENLTTAKVTDEGGVIRCTTLLPKDGVITKIGGPGKEYYGVNVNWDAPEKFMKQVAYGGKWRIAVSPAKAAARDYFLNVIDVGDKPLSEIRCEETAAAAEVAFTTAEGRKITVSFGKTGYLSGWIRIEKEGKILLEEQLTQLIQKQAGFLF
jgi:hypothetical protein